MRFARSRDLCQQKVECPQLTSRRDGKKVVNRVATEYHHVIYKIYTVLKAEIPFQKEENHILCGWLLLIVQHSHEEKREPLKKIEKTSSIATAAAVVVHCNNFPFALEIGFVIVAVVAIQPYEESCLSSCLLRIFLDFIVRFL